MTDAEPGLFDMSSPAPRSSRRRPGRGRNREMWVRTVTAEVIIVDAAAVAETLAEAERSAVPVELAPAPVDEGHAGLDPEQGRIDPVSQVVQMIWASDGQDDLLEAEAFRLLEIASAVIDESTDRGIISWSATVTLTHVDRLRALATRAYPEDASLIEDDLAVAWNHAADPHAPIRWIPGIEWRPLTVDVEHRPARSGRH